MSPLYYRLNKPLDGNKILKDIQKLILDTNNTKKDLLYIDTKNISHETNELIPKLEYKKTPE